MSELKSEPCVLQPKNKCRWTLQGDLPGGELKPLFVKVQSKPDHFCESGSVEVRIVEANDPSPFDGEFWVKVYSSVHIEDQRNPKLGTFILKLYDGFGIECAEYKLENAYISNVVFSDVNYSASEIDLVDLTIKYETCNYTNKCE